eukprot:CAMPEP_0206314880 /NCGR_PEP_ID=MMETSP0106_2-20121207/15249_1 /ASSEMBLY_ACC=CAM_ASM_000206 /TAXON_ID=81532 /ORGANISM="Acanthoeca-like sp., Strain 10tr" /LENGTH=123 /DNA_ID=CAMNT_0053746257 /DNA_START=403 /DNA_END=770 /DNA_ORIENTATION=+
MAFSASYWKVRSTASLYPTGVGPVNCALLWPETHDLLLVNAASSSWLPIDSVTSVVSSTSEGSFPDPPAAPAASRSCVRFNWRASHLSRASRIDGVSRLARPVAGMAALTSWVAILVLRAPPL